MSKQILVGSNFNFKNKIINGDFSIWQRGTVGNASGNGTFVGDRWVVFTENGDISFDWIRVAGDPEILDILNLSYGLKINKIDGGDTITLHQFIENLTQFKVGEKVTISFYAKTTGTPYDIQVALQGTIGRFIKTTNEVVSDTVTVGNSLQRYIFSLQIPDYLSELGDDLDWGALENTALILKIKLPDTTDDFVISGVQLEKDNVATEFEHIPYDIQLQRCLRYYEKIENTVGQLGIPANIRWDYGVKIVNKRTIPSVTYKVVSADGDFTTDTKFSWMKVGNNFINVSFDVSDSDRNGTLITTFYIDAEL